MCPLKCKFGPAYRPQWRIASVDMQILQLTVGEVRLLASQSRGFELEMRITL